MGHPDLPADSGEAAQIEALEARVEALERDLARSRASLLETTTRGKTQAEELRRARRELEGLQRRRAVRLALRVTARTRTLATRGRSTARVAKRAVFFPRRVFRSIRRRVRDYLRQRRLRATPA